MTVVLTLVVRDEEDVLEAFLLHHLRQGVDHVLVTDHGSTDGTPEILAAFARDGVVTVRREDGEAFEQAAWVTRMARAAATDHAADWVVNADADEFFMPAAGRLADLLAALPASAGQLAVPRNDLVPVRGAPGGLPSLTVRETASRGATGHPLEPKAVHRGGADVEVGWGNHDVRGLPGARVPPVGLIDLVHAPMRSWEQFERKVRTMGRAKQGADESADHQHLFALLEGGELEGWWEERLLSEDAVAAGLEAGTLVRDDRLARSLRGEDVAAGGAGAARALVQERVGVALEWVRAHDADPDHPLVRRLAEQDAALADARERIALITSERDVLDRDLEAVRADAAELLRQLESERAARRAVESERAVRAVRRAQSVARRVRPR